MPLPKLRVTFNVERTPVDFEYDTGAVYSVLQEPLRALSGRRALVRRANGSRYSPWTTKRTVDLGNKKVHHSLPESAAR